MSERIIRFGHSPDADDAFMFYGLSTRKVAIEGIRVEHFLEDIQSLNQRAMRGELEVTAISCHAYPYVAKNYWIMKTGASMGEGYGPVLISKKYKTLDELSGKRVATPGAMTTAKLLFQTFTEGMTAVDISFDQIMPRIDSGEFDAGVIIHEGQITYEDEGFLKVLDFGEYWKELYGDLPLPLGLDVVRKDLGHDLASMLSVALQRSIEYGYAHLDDAVDYALQFGRGLNKNLGERFVKMYVNHVTIDMGEIGKRALATLFDVAARRGIVPNVGDFELL
jgi:1,4-dihydroxy-6-naphthoate synthase